MLGRENLNVTYEQVRQKMIFSDSLLFIVFYLETSFKIIPDLKFPDIKRKIYILKRKLDGWMD